MSNSVRVSKRHKVMLDKIVKLEKDNHDGTFGKPTQESVLNCLIEKEAKRKGVSND